MESFTWKPYLTHTQVTGMWYWKHISYCNYSQLLSYRVEKNRRAKNIGKERSKQKTLLSLEIVFTFWQSSADILIDIQINWGPARKFLCLTFCFEGKRGDGKVIYLTLYQCRALIMYPSFESAIEGLRQSYSIKSSAPSKVATHWLNGLCIYAYHSRLLY